MFFFSFVQNNKNKGSKKKEYILHIYIVRMKRSIKCNTNAFAFQLADSVACLLYSSTVSATGDSELSRCWVYRLLGFRVYSGKNESGDAVVSRTPSALSSNSPLESGAAGVACTTT